MSLINFFNLCYILKNGQNFLFPTIYKKSFRYWLNLFPLTVLKLSATENHPADLILMPDIISEMFSILKTNSYFLQIESTRSRINGHYR